VILINFVHLYLHFKLFTGLMALFLHSFLMSNFTLFLQMFSCTFLKHPSNIKKLKQLFVITIVCSYCCFHSHQHTETTCASLLTDHIFLLNLNLLITAYNFCIITCSLSRLAVSFLIPFIFLIALEAFTLFVSLSSIDIFCFSDHLSLPSLSVVTFNALFCSSSCQICFKSLLIFSNYYCLNLSISFQAEFVFDSLFFICTQK
jgi:hypothetical protein